jgi:DNA-binding transcriptional LysR family regulator
MPPCTAMPSPSKSLPHSLERTRFDELAVLVEVAEAGSLGAAAKRLGVPKSTIGRAICRLEEQLGVSLVRRIARGPALTEPGRMLAGMAAPHVAALRDMSAALGRDANEAYGLLRVTAPSDVGAMVLAPLLPGFLARYPRVQIEIEHTLRAVDLVREGFDLAIRITMSRLPSSTLIARKLARMHLGFYAGTAYAARHELPKHPDDLARHHCLTHTAADSTLQIEGPNGLAKVALQGRLRGNDFFFVREAIASGLGIGPLPWFLASPDLAGGRITRVLPDYRVSGGMTYLVHPPSKPLSPKLAAFTAYLHEYAPRLIVQPF